MTNPIGVDVLHPRFSWVLTHPERGQTQSAYQVLVADTKEELAEDKGDVWDSKKIKSGITFLVGTCRSIKDLADQLGYTKTIEEAGGYIICDTCGSVQALLPNPPKVGMYDAMKQVYYPKGSLPIIGSIKESVNAAISGKWIPPA